MEPPISDYDTFLDKLLTKKNFRKNIATNLTSGTLKNNKEKRNSTLKLLKGKIDKYGEQNAYVKKKKDTQQLLSIVEKLDKSNENDKAIEENSTDNNSKADNNSHLYNNVLNNKEEILSYEEQKENFLTQLEQKVKLCKSECKKLETELSIYKSLEEKKKITDFELPVDAKLFDLLVNRILDPEPNWKNKIDILINIPVSIKSENKILRGGDYMEALFQLAIAINILEQFKNKYIKIKDINKYKKLVDYEGSYLYNKEVLNSGGSEKVQGISDITFEVSETPFKSDNIKKKDYKCGDSSSVSDIIIKNKMYFVSVKGFIEERSIKKDYDIPLLYMQTQFFEDQTFEGEKILAVGVKNGNQFKQRLDKTRIGFLPLTVRDNVFSYYTTENENGLLDVFDDFRRDFFIKYPSTNLDDIKNKVRELYPQEIQIKPSLSLYYHQELVARSIINRINSIPDEEKSKPHYMCIGVLPRGGKSFIAGGIIKMYEKLLNKSTGLNILFMTSAVTETISQFKDDLIDKFADFNDYDFVDIRTIKTNPGIKHNKFIFCSRQFATSKEKAINEDNEKVEKQMKDIFKLIQPYTNKIDLVFFDEAHIAVLTPNVQENFKKSFDNFKTPIILMTATYKKPANILTNKSDLFIWDLFDIKDMRSLPEVGYDLFIKQKDQYDVVSRYGEIAIKILEERKSLGQDEYDLAKPYINFPEPEFISPSFHPDIIAKINGSGGFSYEQIFEIQPLKNNIENFNLIKDTKRWKEWDTLLKNYEHATFLKSYITYNPETFNAFKQIFNHSQKHGTSRPRLERPFSVLMFLPTSTESVSALCRIWASFLLKEKFWQEKFMVLTLSVFNDKEMKPKTIKSALEGGNYYLLEQMGGFDGCEDDMLCMREKIRGDDLKTKIIDLEKYALKNGKGLLLLSGDVAKMGISLPCVDIVFLLDSGKESDDIIQKMFRALTDSTGKKFGYIVDINIRRVIESFFIYDLEKDKQNPKSNRLQDKNEKRLNKIADAFNWGYEEFIDANKKNKINYEQLMKDAKQIVLGNLEEIVLDTFVNKINDEIDMFVETSELGKRLFDIIKSTNLSKEKTKEESMKYEQGTNLNVEDKKVSNMTNEYNTKKEETKEKTKKELSELERQIKEENKQKELTKEKIRSMGRTFINSMLIRNDKIVWSNDINIDILLREYNKDKLTAEKPIKCLCDSNSCSTNNNLYERVFCEMINYTDKNVSITYEILDILENLILEDPNIKRTWNNYIESFINKIETIKNIKKVPKLGNV